MYYSAIGVLAMLVLLIENWDFLFESDHISRFSSGKNYRQFLLAVLAYYITDILWGFLESLKLSVLLFADTSFYFIAMSMGLLCWTRFAVAYLEEKNVFSRFLVTAGYAIAGAMAVATLVNLFRPVLFTVDADCVYHALGARYVLLCCQILLFLLVSIYTAYSMQHAEPEKRIRYRTLAFFGLSMALFLFAQLWLPNLPLYSIGYLLGTCLIRAIVVGYELEEQRRRMQESRRNEELKATIVSLLDNMPVMTFTKSAETGEYYACNQAFAEYAHMLHPEEMVGLTAAEIFDAETAAHFDADDKIALSMDEPYVIYEDVTDAMGNQRRLQTTKQKYTDFAGRRCILGICQDMTDLVRVQREAATTKEAYEQARSSSIIYTQIAQALASGYTNLYSINLDSEEFIEYRLDGGGTLTEARRGWHFFEECQLEAEQFVYPDDRAAVKQALDRKTLEAALDRNKNFVMTYRLSGENGPVFVSMRVSRMPGNERSIILGVSDIDEQMQRRYAAERMREEQIAYARLNALSGDYLCVYIVEPETGRYREFSATEDYADFAQAKEGEDFFTSSRESARSVIHPDDMNRFLSTFTREQVLEEIERRGIFTLSYRLMMEGVPTYVQLKAAMVEEQEGRRLIVGLSNIDAQFRQEEEYVKRLAQARIDANIDPLTGVKNRHAYRMAEERLNAQIKENKEAAEFAIVILDVNDLKKVNDTEGHKAGDQYLRDACMIICRIFDHSPVFRVGGDEFAVIAQGSDYHSMDELIGKVSEHNRDALQNGGIVISCGMAKFAGDSSVAGVFERADGQMYENKSELKRRKNA